MQLNHSRSDLLNETTFDLAKARFRPQSEPEPKAPQPRDFDRWLIPGAVVTTAGLLVYAAFHVALHYAEQATGQTVALVASAVGMTAITTLYITDYGRHRSAARNHQRILDELANLRRQRAEDMEQTRAQQTDLRKRIVTAAGENRALLTQILQKMANTNEAHWKGVAEGVRIAVGDECGEVVPFARRPGTGR